MHAFMAKHPLDQKAVFGVSQNDVERTVPALLTALAAPAIHDLAMQVHQLLHTLQISVIGQRHKSISHLCRRLKCHIEQGIERIADLCPKTSRGVDVQNFGVLRQIVFDALQGLAKHRKSALVNMLIEVSRTHKKAVTAMHQLAQNHQRAFIQVVQLIK